MDSSVSRSSTRPSRGRFVRGASASELAALKHRLEVTQHEAARESKRAEAFEKVAEERKTQLAEVLKKQANGTPVALEELQNANERLLHRIAEL